MVIPKEDMQKHEENGEIALYEEDLINRLRHLYYEGLPLSIILNSKLYCVGWCHHMALQLTRGMDHFKLIRGNINTYPIKNKPNHSWVEKDGFVYDTTDGFKWKKEIYYKYFGATPIEIYDQDSYMNLSFYQTELERSRITLEDNNLILLLELLELLEKEESAVNYDRLLNEINILRETKNLTKRLSRENVE